MRSEIEPNFLPLTQQEISEVRPLENLLPKTKFGRARYSNYDIREGTPWQI